MSLYSFSRNRGKGPPSHDTIANRHFFFLLTAFSVIESVFEKLVNWAAAALEKSSNQPVLPHAIIVFNASSNTIDERLWNVEIATTELMESLSRTVYHNTTFKKYAQFWRERNRQIETVEHLLLSYYSSVQVQ